MMKRFMELTLLWFAQNLDWFVIVVLLWCAYQIGQAQGLLLAGEILETLSAGAEK